MRREDAEAIVSAYNSLATAEEVTLDNGIRQVKGRRITKTEYRILEPFLHMSYEMAFSFSDTCSLNADGNLGINVWLKDNDAIVEYLGDTSGIFEALMIRKAIEAVATIYRRVKKDDLYEGCGGVRFNSVVEEGTRK